MASFIRKEIPEWMRERFSINQRFLVLCVVAGILCGLAAVVFHLTIETIFEGLWHLAEGSSPAQFIALMILAPTIGGLLVGWITTRYAPEAVGSGIPQTKMAYYNRGGHVRSYIGLARLALASFYIGLGNSLGREGPTVHISAAIASRLGRWGFRDAARIQSMMPVGVAAGIAAAFNAPLSALTFVFEELLDNFSMKSLGGMVFAVVIAAALSRSILGEDPILATKIQTEFTTSPWMLISLPLGLACGLFGHLFTTSTLQLRKTFRKQSLLPRWIQPAIGGFSCGLIGLAAYYLTRQYGNARHSVFSIGYDSLEAAFQNNLILPILVILFVCKMAAVILNYASGGSGGLFSPTLFLGGILGAIAGVLLTQASADVAWLPALPADHSAVGGCVLLGMGAMFAAVIGCPFTSLLIIFEMTGNYDLILPLMAGNVVAWQISKRLRPIAIYDALLLQDGINIRSLPAYRGAQDYRALPVQSIMTTDVFYLASNLTCGEARAIAREESHLFHAYPVLDSEQRLHGVVTRHDLREQAEDMLLSELIAKQDVLSVTASTSIQKAAQALIRHDYQQVPVVSPSDKQKLVGWLTSNDIARQQNAMGD